MTRARPLDRRVVIVTGGGTGIGRAAAIAAAARGARLLVVGRRPEPLAATVAACADAGSHAAALAVDVAEPSAAAAVVDAALARFGRIDGLVNNAGVARFGPLEECTDAHVRTMFEVNFLAPLRLIRAAAGALRDARGAVVNVSSIGGVVATPGRAAYGALKAGLNHLTRSLARELAPAVRVNAVLPGPVATPMWSDLGIAAPDVDVLFGEMCRTTPAGRLAQPEEIAPWICRLLDPRDRWMTGSLIAVDGGRSS